ncbi:MAG: response regulator [Pleurocapsa sp.]
MIRILLVDDQKTVRESLKAALKPIPDLEVVGTADSGKAAIAQVAKLYPDLVLIDMEMPGLDGIATTRIICEQFTGVRVVVLSMHDEDNYVAQAVMAGAMGYLIKNTPAQELAEAIRSVHKGYAQIGPGLLSKIVPVSTEPVVADSERSQVINQAATNSRQNTKINLYKSTAGNPLRKKKRFYLAIWLVGNLLVWGSSLLYLKFKSPTYTSSWTIALPGTASSTSINLPEIGQASSQNQSPFSNTVSDPRENYRLLAASEDVVKPAADSLKMTLQEFGKPVVEILDNTTLMQLKVAGNTPEESRAKAIAVHEALKDNLDRLKNIESTEPDKNTLKAIEAAQNRLAQARQEFIDYQASTGLNSNAQVENLDNSIEQMRVEQAQLNSQQRRAQGKSNQLLQELKLSPEEAQDALLLHADRLFEQYLDNYTQLKTELINLQAKYLPSHPLVTAQQEDSQAAEAAVLQRASSVLGRSVNLATLNQLGLNSNGNQNNSQKENLLGELINLQGEQQGLSQQAQELGQQIVQLETKQRQRSRFGSELDRLKKNVQIAEAVYSSTLTQLEIDKTNTSNIYPPISLLTQPNLPTEPSSPKTILVLLGSSIATFFLTVGLLSLWWRDRYQQNLLDLDAVSNNNHTNHHHHHNSSNSLDSLDIVIRR